MINPDTLLERNLLKKQVSFWRGFFFFAVIIAILFSLFSLPDLSDLKGFSKDSKGKDYIARINLDGVIFRDSEREEILDKIAKNDKIKAIILNVNSPGGTAVGGESLYLKLKEINEKKPIVTVFNSLATSAAYLLALGTEQIFAHNGTITGSIGVIMEIPNLKETANKLGVDVKYIRTSPLKGAPTLFDSPNPEVYSILEDMMNDFYEYFVQIVAVERSFTMKKARRVADGRVFSGIKAKNEGLVDAIGTEKEALLWLQENKNIDKELKVREVKLYKPQSSLEKLLESSVKFLGLDSLLGVVKVENKGLIL